MKFNCLNEGNEEKGKKINETTGKKINLKDTNVFILSVK